MKTLMFLGALLSSPAPAAPAAAQPTAKAAARAAPAAVSVRPGHVRLRRADVQRFAAAPDALRRDIRLERRKGRVVVRHVRRGSVFWRAGLRPGDRLHRIDGRAVRSESAGFAAAMRFLLTGRAVVELRRKGRPVKVVAELA